MLNKLLLTLFGTLFLLTIQSQEYHYNCFFQFNSAEYHKDSLVKLHTWLDSNPHSIQSVFDLVAYTDTIGTLEFNDKLAKSRLDCIAEILKSRGYKAKDLRIIGKQYSRVNYTTNADFRKVEIHFSHPVIKEKAAVLTIDTSTDWASKTVPRIKTRLEEFEELGNNKKINLSIEFKNNTDEYKDEESEKQVSYLAEFLKKYPNKKVMILGHVCCSNNYAVSNIRAKRVYDDLQKQKISKSRMKYKGMSNTSPLVQEIDAKTEQQNRRVEVVFYE